MALATKPPNVPSSGDSAAKLQQSSIFVGVLNELDVNKDQLRKRQLLIGEIESILSQRYSATNRLISYVIRFGHPRSQMSSADIALLDTVLNSTSGAEQLNIIIHSPGGDGTIVEKMIEMCRAHLVGTSRRLRVIVPNIAKSAATVMSLGADKIIMGYCSELGPIDPQVQISVSGVIQWVSSLAFIEARDNLMAQIDSAVKQGLPTVGFMQQLAGLNIPFTQQMEHATSFAKKTAAKMLEKYMLKTSIPQKKKRENSANAIAEKLLSKQLFPVHGHFIDAHTAKNDLGLEVDILDKDDELWKKIWEYYVRCEVQMNIPINPQFIKIKLIEAGAESLSVQDTPN